MITNDKIAVIFYDIYESYMDFDKLLKMYSIYIFQKYNFNFTTDNILSVFKPKQSLLIIYYQYYRISRETIPITLTSILHYGRADTNS